MRRLRALYDIVWSSCINFTEGPRLVFWYFLWKNDFWPLLEIDAAWLNNVIESLETSHFVGNWLLYHSTLLKQNCLASSEY